MEVVVSEMLQMLAWELEEVVKIVRLVYVVLLV